MMKWEHVPIAIVPADGDGPMAVMQLTTKGRSDVLPAGAVWAEGEPGWWTREPTDEIIFSQVVRAFRGADEEENRRPMPRSYHRITRDIPTDRTYRNAWVFDTGSVTHDMEKARDLHLDMIRNARVEALGALDRDWMKAVGRGDTATASAVEAKRQALRDAPATLDVSKAQTIAELKLLWPKDLPR